MTPCCNEPEKDITDKKVEIKKMNYHYPLDQFILRVKIFQFLWNHCYIYDNESCDCPFRKKTITFKSRYGKKFDKRLIKYAEIFGFETTSGPIFDLTILPTSNEVLEELKGYINTELEIASNYISIPASTN